MKLDKHKFKRQKEGFEKWKANNCRGTWEFVTGMGKTFAAIHAAKYYIKQNPNFKVVVVVPRDPLRDQWRKEARIHGVADNFEIDTVHMHVKEQKSADMLILDELHMYVGEEAEVFPLIFQRVDARKILGLTATLGTEGIRTDLISAYCPVIDRIPLEVALEEGYVSPYIQYNLGIELSPEDRQEYARLNKKFYKYFATFNHDFNMAKKCLGFDKETKRLTNPRAIALASRIRWEHERLFITALNYMRAMRERKQFLYSAPSKLYAAKSIIERFPNKKIITFAQTTEPVDKLAKMVNGALRYHSNIETQIFNENGELIGEKVGKNKYLVDGNAYTLEQLKKQYPNCSRVGKKSIRQRILDDFKSKKSGVLCTAMALDVGYDDDDIDMGIVISATSKQRQHIQRVN
jgi:superfamily II DNA or RNA helicase